MTTVPSDTQNTLREGIIELTFGEPDPALLAVGLVRRAAAAVLDDAGPAVLAYGPPAGPPALRDEIARRSAAREGRACAAGDVVLVESPTYNVALGIMRDHPVEVVGESLDEDGLQLGALQATLAELRAVGKRARLL